MRGWACFLCLVASCGTDPIGGPVMLEGRWSGDLVSGHLPSGSTALVLELDRAIAGEEAAGTIVFGEGDAPAAPTDPDIGWPAGIDPLMGGVPVADGFVYRVIDGSRVEDRVRLEIAITELWEPWCALQTPFALAEGTTEAMCLPNREWTTSPFECRLEAGAMSPAERVDCFKLTLCRRVRVCACTDPGGCVPSDRNLTMRIELSFDGDAASGTISWMREGMPGGTARVAFMRE